MNSLLLNASDNDKQFDLIFLIDPIEKTSGHNVMHVILSKKYVIQSIVFEHAVGTYTDRYR